MCSTNLAKLLAINVDSKYTVFILKSGTRKLPVTLLQYVCKCIHEETFHYSFAFIVLKFECIHYGAYHILDFYNFQAVTIPKLLRFQTVNISVLLVLVIKPTLGNVAIKSQTCSKLGCLMLLVLAPPFQVGKL